MKEVIFPSKLRSGLSKQLQLERAKLLKLLRRCSHCNSAVCIHELRIRCRKLEAALKLLRPVLKKQPLHGVVEGVTKIRRATNQLRDLSVLLHSVHRDRDRVDSAQYSALVHALKKQRKREFSRFLRKQKRKRWVREIQNLTKFRPKFRGGIDKLSAVRHQLLKGISQLRALASDLQKSSVTRKREWHQFRIKAKLLRYQIEFAKRFLGSSVLENLGNELVAAQDHVGKHRDAERQRKLLQRISKRLKLKVLSKNWMIQRGEGGIQSREVVDPIFISQSLWNSLLEARSFLCLEPITDAD